MTTSAPPPSESFTTQASKPKLSRKARKQQAKQAKETKVRKDGYTHEADSMHTITTRLWAATPYTVLDEILRANGWEWSTCLLKLNRQKDNNGGKLTSEVKPAFCKKQNISARMYNGLRISLNGLHDSITELLKTRLFEQEQALAAVESELLETHTTHQTLKADRDKLKRQKAYRMSMFVRSIRFEATPDHLSAIQSHAQSSEVFDDVRTNRKWTRLLKQLDNLHNKQAKLKSAIAELKQEWAREVPGFTLGGKKIIKKRDNLEANGLASHEEWKAEVRLIRESHMYYVGSHDEVCGNQECRASLNEDGKSISLRIKLFPEALNKLTETATSYGQSFTERYGNYIDVKGFLIIPQVYFPRDFQSLKVNLMLGEAVTWRIFRDSLGWRFAASFRKPSVPIVTLSNNLGCIGIDFNVDHLAVAETDKSGNLLEPKIGFRIELPFVQGMSSGQREAILSDALSKVVEYAKSVKKPVVVEDLDFKAKKLAMANEPKSSLKAGRNRQLSSFMYNKYRMLLRSKCRFNGVERIVVNPAYTSLLGVVKYAKLRGVTIHTSAALVIARLGQGFKDTLPNSTSFSVPVGSRIVSLDLPASEKKGKSKEAPAKLGIICKEFKRAVRLEYQGRKKLKDYFDGQRRLRNLKKQEFIRAGIAIPEDFSDWVFDESGNVTDKCGIAGAKTVSPLESIEF